jgi:hypothetical protein
MVRVTVSPAAAAPPTAPVMAMLPADSAMLMTSSEVMLLVRVMVGTGAVLSNKSSPVVLSGVALPAGSVTVAVTG